MKKTFKNILELFWFGLFGAAIAAWVTHVFFCFSDDRWGFLIAGALFFPIAIVHGLGIWVGIF